MYCWADKNLLYTKNVTIPSYPACDGNDLDLVNWLKWLGAPPYAGAVG